MQRRREALHVVNPVSSEDEATLICGGLQSMIRRVDLFTLKLFLSVIEEGQIGRAAAREHVVPSAATRRIQELELIAGAKLFERSAKGVVPSLAGETVARHVRVALDALEGMCEELTALSGDGAGKLSIAATRPLIVYFLGAEIGKFARRFPLREVQLREEPYLGTLHALTSGEVELAVFDTRRTDSAIAGIQSLECRKDRLVAVVPAQHPLAAASVVSLETLLDHSIIGTRPGSCLMANLRHAADNLGRELRLSRSVDTLEAARSLVSAGLGVALQPASGALPTGASDHVVILPIEGDWASLSYRVGWRVGRPLSTAAAALIEQLTCPDNCSTQ